MTLLKFAVQQCIQLLRFTEHATKRHVTKYDAQVTVFKTGTTLPFSLQDLKE